MSDLSGNHIVGFPTRRLKYNVAVILMSNQEMKYICLTVLGRNIFFAGSLLSPPISGVSVRLLGQIMAGGNSPDDGVPRLGGRLRTADWALDLLPLVAEIIKKGKCSFLFWQNLISHFFIR